MSKKRTSDESCNNAADEQTNNGAAADLPQDEDNAKRVKLTSYTSGTMLQDLPIELIESILIKVVVMEVKNTKLAKSVWTEKAELVINRLAAVCSQWSSVLSTDVFRTRLDRALEGTIRLEILQQHTIPFYVSAATTFRDKVFFLRRGYREDDYINVYDWNNMAVVKYVIPLPGLDAEKIVACTVSNCVYILNRKKYNHYSLLRITGDSDPRWSTLSEVIEDMNLPECRFCVAASGSLILSRKQGTRIPAISIFDANGSLQQTIRVPSDIADFDEIIPQSNGNLVLRESRRLSYDEVDDDDDDDDDDYYGDDDDDYDYDCDYGWQVTLTEIDMNGAKLSRCLISLGDVGNLDLHSSIVDSHGRMMVLSKRKGVQLLDTEFNRMDFTCPQVIEPVFVPLTFHYNSERNEAIMIDNDIDMDQADVTVFRLEEL